MQTEELVAVIGEVSFERYANDFFIYQRKGLFKSKSTAAKMMKWKNELIKTPLRKLSAPDLHKMALQIFRNITGFMGDRKSSKRPEEHASKILLYIMTSPVELHDEIFCQLCKQLTGNPNVKSVKHGWELMVLCLYVVPPSPELLYPLLSFFCMHMKSEDSEVSKYGLHCLHSCLKRSRLGIKPECEFPPSADMSTIWTL